MALTRFSARVGASRQSRLTTSASSREATQSVRNSMRLIIEDYSRLISYFEEASPSVIYDALLPTFEKSQEYCPIESGELRKSGYLEIVGNRVEIGYGRGGNPDYAATVHENLEWRHKAPTRAKWLQVALAEDEQEIQGRIVSSYRRVFA